MNFRMTEQEKFEAWVKNPHMLDKSTSPDDFGQYTHPWTIGAWKGWQSAIASQWQPIETAPKDGTQVLTCYHGADYQINTFTNYDNVASGYRLGRDKTWWNSAPNRQPDHWMPLPPPPKE